MIDKSGLETDSQQWAEADMREPAKPTRSRALFWPELARLPRPEYLVKGVLDAGSLAEIFGPTYCGKSGSPRQSFADATG